MLKPESCQGCPYLNRPAVEGDGYVNAELIIIGQSPGPQEKVEGKPFVGPSGQVLNRALRQAGISRIQNYVTNVVKCFVPPGEKVDPLAVKHCRPILESELSHLPRAKTILAVGQEAFNSLTGKELKLVHNRKAAEKSSTTWLRGAPLQLGDGRVVIGTLHPAFVMRSGFLNAPTFEHDVARAGAFARGDERVPVESFSHSPTDEEIISLVDEAIRLGTCAVDIETHETTSGSSEEDELDAVTETHINLIGLSTHLGTALGVHPHQFHLLDRLFNGGDWAPVRCWVYNGGFDFLHLGKHWTLRGVTPADAMIAFYLLWSDTMSFDFATAASYYCNFGYYKNWRLLNPILYGTIGNARDTYGAMEIGEKCLAEMRTKQINMEPLFWSLMPVIKAVEPWRTQGCNYDVAGSAALYIQLCQMLEGYDSWWKQNIPRWDWSSPKQLIEMFQSMGAKVPLKKRPPSKGHPTGHYSPSVDDDSLETIKTKAEKEKQHGIVQLTNLIQEMRTLRKASDFVDLADRDGRVRTRAKLHGQAGGRIQLVDKSLQTIPETLGGTYPRSLIIPDHKDDLILVADYSQAEFFIYAWYTQDPLLMELHASGEYCYGFFHEEIWKEPFFEQGQPRQKRFMRKDIEPWKLLVTKSYPLGFTYGRRAVESQYKWLLDWYHRRFTKVAPFHSELEFRATREGHLQTCFGRMRRFPNPKGQHNQLLAFPGQSTLPDVLARNAILGLSEVLPRNFGERSRVLFTVHDSAVCNIQGAARSVKTAYNAIDCVDEVMGAPIPEMGGFQLRTESKIGPNWGVNFVKHKLDAWWRELGLPD